MNLKLKFHQKVMIAVAASVLIVNTWVAAYLAASKQTADPNFIKAVTGAANMALLVVLVWAASRSPKDHATVKPSP